VVTFVHADADTKHVKPLGTARGSAAQRSVGEWVVQVTVLVADVAVVIVSLVERLLLVHVGYNSSANFCCVLKQYKTDYVRHWSIAKDIIQT
jgi:hypothetical protein